LVAETAIFPEVDVLQSNSLNVEGSQPVAETKTAPTLALFPHVDPMFKLRSPPVALVVIANQTVFTAAKHAGDHPPGAAPALDEVTVPSGQACMAPAQSLLDGWAKRCNPCNNGNNRTKNLTCFIWGNEGNNFKPEFPCLQEIVGQVCQL
jgi:hypothetical protein